MCPVSACCSSGCPPRCLELVVTAHSIDFGTKGFANLVELAAIELHVASSLGAGVGRLVLRVTSAHVYGSDLEAARVFAGRRGSVLTWQFDIATFS